MSGLLNWLVGGAAVAAVAALGARLIPANAPAQRHAYWWLTLASVVALPWLPSLIAKPATATVLSAVTAGTVDGATFLVVLPSLPFWLPTLAIVVWAIVATASCVRLALNVRAIRRLVGAARPLPAERAGRLEQFARARIGSRAAHVCVSHEVRGACAVGFIRPHILLSSDLVATLDDEAIEAIVLHEYAHLQRWDDWSRLLQRFVVALVGFHPAVRWIARRIDVECEAACDHLVVARTGAALTYARSLASAAEIASRMSGLAPLAAPGAPLPGGGLHVRVARLLAATPARPLVTWAAAVAGTAGLGLATVAAAGMPPLVTVRTLRSLEAPLQTLVATPLGVRVLRALPAGAGLQVTVGAADAAQPLQSAPDRVVVASTPASEPAAREAFTPPPVAALEPAAESPMGTAVLPSRMAGRPLAPAMAPPAAEQLPPGRTGNIGSDAARLGVVTGEAATRAGRSIGRFFKNGGQAIASSF